MTAAVAAPTFSRDDLVLYIQLLLERGGPHGHQITAALGYPSRQVYDALESQARGLRMQSILITEWVPDALDRAAIRALCDVILLHHYEPEFKTMTGRTFADVRRLRDRSVSRSDRWPTETVRCTSMWAASSHTSQRRASIHPPQIP
jgi:hypothetical protein